MPRAEMDFVLSLELAMPDLSEQRRIVDLLARAEGIVRLRREAQQKAAELVPAIFIDMFGDPNKNPKRLRTLPLKDLVAEFRYGTSQKSGPIGSPVLRIPNVVSGALNLDEIKLVALKDHEYTRLLLRDGDLLFVRTNGNPDYVGRCAVYEESALRAAGFDGDDCVYASYLIRARVVAERASPTYLQAYLSGAHGRRLLRERAKTSAGQFNVNIDGLGSIPVLLPDAAFQTTFKLHVEAAESIIAQQDAAKAKAVASFEALLAQAFTHRIEEAA